MKKTLSITLCGAALAGLLSAGCGNSDAFVFTNPPNPIQPQPALPVAVDDAFAALGNATVNYAAAQGVLVNDTLNGAVISAFEAVGSEGGTLTLNADGSLTYNPVFGFVGTETFDYTLSNPDGDSTATITFTSTAKAFFVNNQAAAGGDGSQSAPFQDLASGLMAAGAGDTVFVYGGDGTPIAGPINLPIGVNLIGQGNGLVAAQQIEPAGQAPRIDDGLNLLGNNTVSGFVFGGTDGINADTVSNVTITNNSFEVSSKRVHNVELHDVSGSVVCSANTFFCQNDNRGINANLADVTTNVTFNDNQFSLTGDMDTDEALGLQVTGTSNCQADISGNTVTGSGISNSSQNFDYGIEVDTRDNAQLQAIFNNNTITGISGFAYQLDSTDTSSYSWAMDQNMLSDCENGFFEMDIVQMSTMQAVLTNSSLDGATDSGLDAGANADSRLFLAVRDTVIQNVEDYCLLLDPSDNGVVCLELTGCTLNSTLQQLFFDSTGTVNVERLDAGTGGPLESVNTFVGGIDIRTGGAVTVNAVNPGTCGLP